ncbi:MAG: hypothetical protein JWN13_2976 [Betaproteobacteria bacterium]|jgi:hypothetical protein|nr:hypothetical protein [Betaproteobacteria bacterium]
MIDSLPAKGSNFKAFNQAAQKEPKDTKEPLKNSIRTIVVQSSAFHERNVNLKAVYQALDTISQMHYVEINQQPNSVPAQLEIAEQLGIVQWDNFVDGF